MNTRKNHLNLTTETEKKRLSLSPLQMMKKFYNSYNKGVPNDRRDRIKTQFSGQVQKSNSAHKMTKFLLDYQRNNSTGNTISPDSNRLTKNKILLANIAPKTASNIQSTIESEKRCYFKNAFSDSHPLLLTTHKISPKQIQNQARKMSTQPTVDLGPQIFRPEQKLVTPGQKRDAVREIKDKMIRIKNIKRQKMQKVRYNYLVTNCFKPHFAKQPLKITPKPTMDGFIQTRESIFPTEQTVKEKIFS